MTRETIAKLPEAAQKEIDLLRNAYKTNDAYHDREITRARAAGYTSGLQDAGIITDMERRVLYIYVTL